MSSINDRINLVYKSLLQIEKLNGEFILNEAFKLMKGGENGKDKRNN